MIQVNALIPALVAGNSVLLKPSPQTPLVAERIQESFEAAGIPRGLIQVSEGGVAFFSLGCHLGTEGRGRRVAAPRGILCYSLSLSLFQALTGPLDPGTGYHANADAAAATDIAPQPPADGSPRRAPPRALRLLHRLGPERQTRRKDRRPRRCRRARSGGVQVGGVGIGREGCCVCQRG